MKTQHWLWIWTAYTGLCMLASWVLIAHGLWDALLCMTPAFLIAANGFRETFSMIRRFGKD